MTHFCTLTGDNNIEMSVESLDDVNKTITLRGKASDTIKSLKSKIQAQEDIDINDQRLIFNSEVLRDESTLSSCNIQNGAVLYLGLKRRGNYIYISCTFVLSMWAGSGLPQLCERFIVRYSVRQCNFYDVFVHFLSVYNPTSLVYIPILILLL